MKKQYDLQTVRWMGKYELIGPVTLPLQLRNGNVGEFTIWYFRFPGGQYAAIVNGDPSKCKAPLVRIESVCIWAQFFGSLYCDCAWQMEESKVRIDKAGNGLIIFAFDQHGKAVGLRNHFIVYAEGQRQGHELVVDAYTSLGLNEDYRKDYEDIATILRHFDLTTIRLMSNNPERISLLKQQGISIRRVSLVAPTDRYNEAELATKKRRLGHMLDSDREEYQESINQLEKAVKSK